MSFVKGALFRFQAVLSRVPGKVACKLQDPFGSNRPLRCCSLWSVPWQRAVRALEGNIISEVYVASRSHSALYVCFLDCRPVSI